MCFKSMYRYTAFDEYIKEYISADRVFCDEPMSRHTTFRVGGPADRFVEISSVSELSAVVKYLHMTGNDFFVLGNGSNLLVSDSGYRGIILHIGSGMGDIGISGNTVRAGAGALLSTTAKKACAEGLTGMEFATGIPGSIGGAMVMNAGAYDGEMGMVTDRVKVATYDGEILNLDNKSMDFKYRESSVKNRPYVVLEATFKLEQGDKDKIDAKVKELDEKRRSKQPLDYPSAGSTFKRPEGHFAGKLIMDAGLRGYRVGGAQVSEKHCGFVINIGNATAADIYELMQEVSEKVYDKFDVRLEPEVIRLGF